MVKSLSFVWSFFERNADGTAKCSALKGNGKKLHEKCNEIIKWKNGTSGMIQHLKRCHNIGSAIIEESSDLVGGPLKKQQKLDNFVLKSSLKEELSKCIAVDNCNFSQIANTSLIQYALRLKFPNEHIPKCPDTIASYMNHFYESVKYEICSEIKEMKMQGKRFAITLDEWTSIANRRYLNINIHYNNNGSIKFINCGLIRIIGSATAAAIFDLVWKSFR